MRGTILSALLAAAALAALAAEAAGQCPSCPGGRCPITPTYAPGQPGGFAGLLATPAKPVVTGTVAGVRVECYAKPGDLVAGRWTFAVDGREIGTMTESDGVFRSVDGHVWEFCHGCRCGGKCECPDCKGKVTAADPPGGEFIQARTGDPIPGGVERAKMAAGGRERWTIGGEEVDKARAIAALESPGNLVDDSRYLRLTVIGSDAERKRVLADLKSDPGLSNLAGSMLVREYPPDHWAVKDAGFKLDGRPTIYVQAADGKVLHRQDDYDGGPDRLAGAIRKARPDYDPKKDPDLSKPSAPAPGPQPSPAPAPPPTPTPAPRPVAPLSIPAWLVALLAAAGYILIRRSPAPTK